MRIAGVRALPPVAWKSTAGATGDAGLRGDANEFRVAESVEGRPAKLVPYVGGKPSSSSSGDSVSSSNPGGRKVLLCA